MASIIVVEANGAEIFRAEAAELLRAHGFQEVSDGTFVGDAAAEPLVARLKTLASYNNGVELHHGFVSKA